jgi:hypothetical protein
MTTFIYTCPTPGCTSTNLFRIVTGVIEGAQVMAVGSEVGLGELFHEIRGYPEIRFECGNEHTLTGIEDDDDLIDYLKDLPLR